MERFIIKHREASIGLVDDIVYLNDRDNGIVFSAADVLNPMQKSISLESRNLTSNL